MTALIAYADGADCGHVHPGLVADLLGLGEFEVLVGWTPEPRQWLADSSVRGRAFMAGYGLDAAIREQRLRYLPVRLSAVPTFLRSNRPDVAVVHGIRRGDSYAFTRTVGWGAALAECATGVVVEVDQFSTDIGAPLIPGNIVATLPAELSGPDTSVQRAPDDIERAVARNLVSCFPDLPTIQVGPGGIGQAIVEAIDRPVRVWSGLVTNSIVELDERSLLVGVATAGYTWGTARLTEFAQAGKVALRRVEETHDPSTVAATPRFVACNTALQVGLDGSVNVERVRGRLVAGIGGHADFCAAASRSAGGLSLIALRSTDRSGRSTIVRSVEVVSTQRSDVDMVITEHGVADFRGVDDEERSIRLIAIAAPEHRPALRLGVDV
jgi:acyl-CoA hydrolase